VSRRGLTSTNVVPAELDLKLRLAAFEAVYGGFEGESFAAESDQLIVLARG